MSTVVIVPFRLTGGAVIIKAGVNGHETDLFLDASPGASAMPVFNGYDFLAYIPVARAGEAEVDITLGDVTFRAEKSFIDLSLHGYSMLGLPFFLAKAKELVINFERGEICFTASDGEEPKSADVLKLAPLFQRRAAARPSAPAAKAA